MSAAVSDLWLDMIATSLAPELRAQPWKTPGEMAKALDRTTVQTPALDVIDQLLVDVANGECERAIINMPPQEGKSERASRRRRSGCSPTTSVRSPPPSGHLGRGRGRAGVRGRRRRCGTWRSCVRGAAVRGVGMRCMRGSWRRWRGRSTRLPSREALDTGEVHGAQ